MYSKLNYANRANLYMKLWHLSGFKGVEMFDFFFFFFLMIHRVEAEKARASTQAHAEAKSQVHGEVSRLLSEQRAAAQESLQQAFIRERIAAEDEKLRAHLLVSP